MKKFNQRGGHFGGGFKGREDRGFGGRGGSDRPAMHRATCSDCGKSCEVPFRPTGDKPVLCSDCFSRSKEDFRGKRFDRSSSRPSFGEKQMFPATCSECGNHCEVPFRPTGDKPVFCSNCFGQNEKGRERRSEASHNSGQYENQFREINKKLDEILKSLSIPTTTKTVANKEKATEKVVAPIEEKKKVAEPKKAKAKAEKKVAAPKKKKK